ncbi:MAG: phosphatidylserine decarboxylase [Clostridia bacterium]|nr:phosphatidylserine decarboxylase [Clostridia bacterium]
MSMYYDRRTRQTKTEAQYGGAYLNVLYHSALGRCLLKLIISPGFSKINAVYQNSALSRHKIKGFIEQYHIDLKLYEDKHYHSFNEFFTRKKRHATFDENQQTFISPADSRLLVYRIDQDLTIQVKQSCYTLKELLETDDDLKEYQNGSCLVFRLAMDDYHRYCFVDDGVLTGFKRIRGKLHTVSSISDHHKVYSQNTRVINYLKTEHFDDLIFVEVGALLVGRIQNHNKTSYQKGEEKGYFELGGSTIIILTKKLVKIDDDIMEQSRQGIETKVQYGEGIGVISC